MAVEGRYFRQYGNLGKAMFFRRLRQLNFKCIKKESSIEEMNDAGKKELNAPSERPG